jgi:hypothetical protein
LVWDWERVPGDIGCPSNDALVDIGGAIAFLGNDDFYIFDGSRPIPIGEGIREEFFAEYDVSKGYRTMGVYDVPEGNIWWFYCSRSNSGTRPDKCLIYNVRMRKWGRAAEAPDAVGRYYGAGITYHGLGTEYSTYQDLPTDITYDSSYWTAGNPNVTLIKSDFKIYEMNGSPKDSFITLNNIGDDSRFTSFRRLTPRFYIEPVSSTMDYLYDNDNGDSFTTKMSVSYDTRKRYDVLWSSRWHRCRLNMVGDWEISSARASILPDGSD